MIVKSILDTDLYAYMKLFPHAIGTFEFFDRDNTEDWVSVYDGVRQDSGDEFKFVTSAIARYKELGIREYCRGRIRCAFGIGTNDTGHKPSNIVMKLTSCQMNKNQPVFNCLMKHTGLEQEVEHCMNELGL